MKVLRRLVVAFSVIGALAARADQVPSLSVGSLKSATDNPWVMGWDNRESALRGVLISELAQRYDCHVQTRWQGLGVVQEQALTELAYIDRLRVPANQIQTADVVLAAHFNETQQGAAVTGQVICVNMRLPPTAQPKAGGTGARTMFGLAEAMAEAAARLVPLRPRAQADASRRPIGKDAVLVVCALANVVPLSRKEEESALLLTEGALQEKGFTRLVDRRRLEAVLKERTLEASGLDASGTVNPRLLASLVHADFLIMGQLAPWPNGQRLDLYLTQAASGAILAARTGYLVKGAALADVAARCAAELVETPVALPAMRPSSAEARMREARLLLSNEFYPAGMKHRDGVASMLNAVEGAYVLVHDDEAFVYEIMDRLSDKISDTGEIEAFEADWRPILMKACRLVNCALEPLGVSAERPRVLLMRAEALSYSGHYAEGLALVERHLTEYPGDGLKRACIVGAVSASRSGLDERALAYLDRANLRESGNLIVRRVLADIQKRRFEREIAGVKGAGAQAEYEKIRTLFMTPSARPTFDDLTRYLDLMRATKGPEKALSSEDLSYRAEVYWQGRHWQDLDKMMILLHKAICEEQRGNTAEAVRFGKDVMAVIDRPNQTFHYAPTDRMYTEATNLVKRGEALIGSVKERWKTPREVRPFKESDYRIYVVPVGDEIKATMDNIHMFLTNFYGQSVVFLPQVAVARDGAPTPKDNGYQYDWKVLFNQALRGLAVPDDALMLVFITRHVIDTPYHYAGEADSPRTAVANPVFLSYFKCWLSNEPKAARAGARRFSFEIPRIQHLYYGARDAKQKFPRGYEFCAHYPCMFCDSLFDIAVRIQMCPACQEEYAKADFEAIHNELMRYLKSKDVKIVRAGIL